MPRKVRELIKELKKASFVNRGGKGSHRNFVHPKVTKPITISGQVMMHWIIKKKQSNQQLRSQKDERQRKICKDH